MELMLQNNVIAQEAAEVMACIYEDYAGGRCDALHIILADNEYIRSLKLKKGQQISIKNGILSSGDMYLSEIGYEGGRIDIRAVSMSMECRRAKTDAKKDISFYEMVKDVELETGYQVIMQDMKQVSYKSIVRINKNPMQYLISRLELEGYEMKVYDNKIIIFDEKRKETEAAKETLEESDFIGKLQYITTDSHLIASVENKYSYGTDMIMSYIESGLSGRSLTENIAAGSIEESERFCKGIMRLANKNEYQVYGWMTGLKYRSGEVVELNTSIEGHSGNNYIFKIRHDMLNEKQMLYMRKAIKGDY